MNSKISFVLSISTGQISISISVGEITARWDFQSEILIEYCQNDRNL